MILSCNSCGKKFVVPDNAITEAGRLVQCSACGNKWKQFPVKITEKKKVISKTVAKKNITKPVSPKKPISPKKPKSIKRKLDNMMTSLLHVDTNSIELNEGDVVNRHLMDKLMKLGLIKSKEELEIILNIDNKQKSFSYGSISLFKD